MELKKKVSSVLVGAAGRLFVTLLRTIPRSARYSTVILLGRMIPRRLRHTRSARFESRPGISSLRELFVGAAIELLDLHRIAFDPLICSNAGPILLETRQSGRGALFVGTHANGVLMRAAIRTLVDSGQAVATVSIRDPFPVCGMAKAIPAIRPDGAFLLTVLLCLRKGFMVSALVDTFDRSMNWPLEIRGTRGSFWATDSLMWVAHKAGASIVFVAARLTDDGRITINNVPASEGNDFLTIRSEFVSFIEQHITETARSRPGPA